MAVRRRRVAESRPDSPEAGACHTGEGDRRALAVDAPVKDRAVTRLRRIEGQVRGLQRMVADERYCADVLAQIASVQEALRGVSRELLRNHLRHCATSAILEGEREAEAMYDEIVELFHKHTR
jgi:DNA-binding FrmR family transcriptional regulator